MNTFTLTVNDPIYYGPNAIGEKAGKFFKYGKRHGENVELSLTVGYLGYETLKMKSSKMKSFQSVSPCWLIGCNDEKGEQKLGFTLLYNGNGAEFHLYLSEFVEILRKLGSVEMLKFWKDQL